MKKIGLAISGGGIKSFSAIGVLQYLEEVKIKPTFFSGTSMGSVIASLLAMGVSAEEIKTDLLELENIFDTEKIITPSIKGVLSMSSGYANADVVEERLQVLFAKYQVTNISDVKAPLVISSVDLVTGKLVHFTNRKKLLSDRKEVIVIDDIPLATAVTASCSFPLVFQTRKWGDMELVDGGVRENLPIVPLRMIGAELVLSVSMQNILSDQSFDSVISVGKRVMNLMLAQSTLFTITLADLNINVKLDTDNPFEFKYGTIAIQKGYEECETQKESIEAFRKNANRLFSFRK
jgi:Predicted esterase of the alpha-beta hydrolase superfamily